LLRHTWLPGSLFQIKVYQQKDLTDTATYGAALTGLSINVSNGAQTVKLTEGASGTYTYSDASFITAGKTYTMQFTYNNMAHKCIDSDAG
jgi:hypothetical protein